MVSLHAGSGLCGSGLLHAALKRAVSFLIPVRRVDNAVHETQDSPPLKFLFFTEENIHMYFVELCAGFELFSVFVGAIFLQNPKYTDSKAYTKMTQCYSAVILYFGM